MSYEVIKDLKENKIIKGENNKLKRKVIVDFFYFNKRKSYVKKERLNTLLSIRASNITVLIPLFKEKINLASITFLWLF
jgi:hypothetical protein